MDARKRLLGFKAISIDDESVCLFILQSDSGKPAHVVSRLVSQTPCDDNPGYTTKEYLNDEKSPLPAMTFNEIIAKERLKQFGVTCFDDAMVIVPEDPQHKFKIYLYQQKDQEKFSKRFE
jgi:hypothetical protein